ncbi:MAG: hypothetical protein HQL69_03385 [Magnetococcales bacterium]|nr:hypothetical protein [Magnetococcales bacterium]
MGQAATSNDDFIIKRHPKGNNELTNELVKLSLNQYRSDKDIRLLTVELQKIALNCSRSVLTH